VIARHDHDGSDSPIDLPPIETATPGNRHEHRGNPLSRVTELRASLRDGVLDMRALRRELQWRSGELKAHRRELGEACATVRHWLRDRATSTATPSPPPPAAQGILGRLSPMQRRVLEGILAGKPNKTIAFDLGVSAKTVETHRARVMLKLQAESLVELVRICTVAGMGESI
jgi:DNA-binding CsgD family transcriptional regulator